MGLRKREEMMKKEEQLEKRGTESWKKWRPKLKRRKSLEGMMTLVIEMVIYLLRKKNEEEGMIHPILRKKMKHLQERKTRRKEMTVKRRYQGGKVRKLRKEARRMRALMKNRKVRRKDQRKKRKRKDLIVKVRRVK